MSDESVFFDTNILVYANDVSAGEKQVVARRLISESLRTGTGTVSAQVLSEFWVTVTRKLPVPLDRDLAERQLAFFSAFKVIAIDLGLVLTAVKIQHRQGISYWDALIVAAARAADCRLLYSEDMQDGVDFDGIRVSNPFANSVA